VLKTNGGTGTVGVDVAMASSFRQPVITNNPAKKRPKNNIRRETNKAPVGVNKMQSP
jgi:hypothetical protein